tara:strand:+ start:649 stop:1080 length:432 start_codon:yes stop_codon:yes gene_type:complete
MLDLFDDKNDRITDHEEEIVKNYFSEIDMCGGPTMSLRKLENFVLTAPKAVRNEDHFCHLIGLLMARYQYELVGGFDATAQVGPFMPFDQLEEFIMNLGYPDGPENADESRWIKMLRGFYDGRLIHEQLGGINNEDDTDLAIP